MAKPLIIPVKEELQELHKMLKKVQPMFVGRVQMLIEMKKEGDKGISKRELMERTGASSQSITHWRRFYKEGGIERLLSHNRRCCKPSVFTQQEHDKISELLHNPNNNLTGFVDLREWVKTEFKKEVRYNTLLKYCIQNFGAKTKVARKSHIHKDDKKVEAFKKTLVITAGKQ